MFGINSNTGEVFANQALLNPGKHTIIVNASDQPIDPKEMRYSLAVVTVTVIAEGSIFILKFFIHQNKHHNKIKYILNHRNNQSRFCQRPV